MVNPFCFVVQVLASLLQMQAPRTCAEEGIAMQRLVIDVSARDIDCPVNNIFQPLSVATTPTPASVTSHHRLPPEGIRSSSLAFGIGGLGSSTSDAMGNLFGFVVQVLAPLLQMQAPRTCAEEGTAMQRLVIDVSARDIDCPVDIFQPLSVAATPAPASVTSHHRLPPAGIRSSSLALGISGLGSSTSDTMGNPFCFVVQVLASLLQMQAPRTCAEEGIAMQRLLIDVSARDIDCPVDNIFQPLIVATTPAPASVTSHHRLPPAGIRSSSLAFGISGLGSSTSDTMGNPFCFVVQVLASLLQMQAPRTCAEEGIAMQRLVIDVSARDIDCPVDNIFQPLIVGTTPAPASVSSHHRLPPAGIRSSSLAFGISGLGSSTSDTMGNPFCFVVQVLASLLQMQAPRTCAEEGIAMQRLVIDVSARDIDCPVDNIFQPLSVATTPAPASVTSHHRLPPEGIRSSSLAFGIGGLGSSTSDAMGNLFGFVVQVLAPLLQMQAPRTCAEEGIAMQRLVIDVSARDIDCPVDIFQPLSVAATPAPASVTSHHRLPPAGIRSSSLALGISGLGSSTSDTMGNPFCFVVQVLASLLQMQAPRTCAEEGIAMQRLLIDVSARDIDCPVDNIFQPLIVATTPAPASVTSHHRLPPAGSSFLATNASTAYLRRRRNCHAAPGHRRICTRH
ncbi:uncharacterized protein [Dermacentor albipictus]|uniref:uncharacterized protein n=1 Tax=Dermacentor albipictus TaxID=60249 RepID=UPI0038FC8C33